MTNKPRKREVTKAEAKKLHDQVLKLYNETEGPAKYCLLRALEGLEDAIKYGKK